MKTFNNFIDEARIHLPKYTSGDPFTLNHQSPNAIHKALATQNYTPGTTFKKSDEDAAVEIGDPDARGAVSVTLEDEKGKIIKVWGTASALNGAFNKGDSAGGGTMKAADWEEVITIAHNMFISETNPKTMDEAATDGDIKLPIKPKIVAKINNGQGYKIISASKPSLPPQTMIHFGRGKGSPSTLWSDTFKDLGIKMNPKSMTPKTDMYIGDMRISLKQSGGSQLMSGYGGDTLGVITAAYNKASKEQKTKDALANLERTFEYMYQDVKDNFEASQDVGAGSREIAKKAKAGGSLNAIEKAVMDTVHKGEAVQEHFRQVFGQHPWVKYYTVEEAMTGNMKFADNNPRSNYLMVFSPDGQGTHIDKIDKGIIDDYVSKVTWSVGIKSAGGRGALSLRGIVKDEYEPTSTMKQIISEAWDEIGEDRIYLAEGLWKNIKDKATSAVNWAKEKGLKVLKILWDKIVGKIIKLLAEGFVWIQRIFGWRPTARLTSNPYFV